MSHYVIQGRILANLADGSENRAAVCDKKIKQVNVQNGFVPLPGIVTWELDWLVYAKRDLKTQETSKV